MLVRSQPESTLVDLGEFLQPGLEVTARLICHASVLDEHHEVVSAVFALVPTKVVDIAIEGERTGGLESVSEELLDLGLIDIESHAVDGVLETSVLATE